ncbi:ABC transporter permease [Vineibacter terrae]|uniref:ABC transporter permease n=1 Tax=Vineibacter terrae TaxID=2586908 RepID=UPI002E30BE24|nr:ABC transporter permease [Vineibacter terrae]HEX2885595.1 ABC transporter permease [Vineibacter terrae]
MTVQTEQGERPPNGLVAIPRLLFMRVGVLPFFLVAALIVFAIASSQFLTTQNLINVARQSVYLVLVSLGQMIVLLTGGFDLAVGTTIALTSVLSAIAMVALAPTFPDAIWLVITIACLGAMAVALLIGLVNGTGVAVFGVSPFIMTLGVQSVGAGAALFLTGGVPVAGMPHAFGDTFGFGRVFGVPVPVMVAIIAIAVMAVFLYGTRAGRHLYAVGGNIKAAKLSGVDTIRTLLVAYAASALLASVAGLLLTARVESGEANLGGTVALESIAACVIGGVSLRGGIGRVENVVLGAFFIVLVQNGMNLMQIGSYMQMVLLGVLLILAVVGDQFRYRLIVGAPLGSS